MAAEAHVPTHGALGAAAVASLAVGVALLVSAAGGAAIAAILAALAVALAGGAWMTVLVRKASACAACARRATRSSAGSAWSRRRRTRSARSSSTASLWRARVWGLDEDERPLHPGDRCVVERVEGLTLTVRPAEEWELI